jgi:membrane-associated HD superfamily phosphohydrolase
MLGNLLLVLVIALALAVVDARNFLRAERKAKALYILLLIPAVYLSILFVFQLSWFNIGQLTRAMYGWPAHWIVALLK